MASYHSHGAAERPDEAENQVGRNRAKRIRLALTCAIEAHASAADSLVDLLAELHEAFSVEVPVEVDRMVFEAAHQVNYQQTPPRRLIARANFRVRDFMQSLRRSAFSDESARRTA